LGKFDCMLGTLSEEQIEDLLKSLPVGRIGCYAGGITYIVPVNYVYDGIYIYAHSAEGMKIDMMRKNPDVCFETDAIIDLQNWKSVIAWGKFEEITNIQEKTQVMQMIINRIMPLMQGDAAQPSHGFTRDASDVGDGVELILYKIVLSKKTGRFEKNEG
jgi:nitroimidazol reductase NimA-like FMN-containing flavoprotein (pyridoxamine 5'-phosphate oxidase superfamily)